MAGSAAGGGGASGAAFNRSFVMQAKAHAATPQAPSAAHSHPHTRRYSSVSLLGASVLARLAIVAGIAAVLWIAIAWALA